MSEPINTNRRGFLRTLGGAAGAAMLGPLATSPARASQTPVGYRLKVASSEAALVGPPHPATRVWSYNNQIPGPQLRVRQGDRLRVEVENTLQEETTVHWHGIRLANAMDGVPHLTQTPIAANGGKFIYEFALPDAGTFWYHPHTRSHEQVARGLSGILIVEEPEPPKVDRDIAWVLDDWRLQRDAQVAANFGNMHDASHGGRFGNTVTVNGVIPESETVRAGERIRLRLVNVANARTFGLEFADHDPQIVAIDGQPVEPHRPDYGIVIVGAAMRVDLILDMSGKPGAKYQVIDRYYQRRQYRLLDLAYSDQAPLRDSPLDAGISLPANPLPEPDIKTAERHQVVLAGGAMGRMRSGIVQGKQTPIRDMVRQGLVWTVNGIAVRGHTPEPLFTLKRNRSYVFEMLNDTSWEHPMHLHGYSFRVLTRNGTAVPRRPWQDTVLLQPDDRVEIAFVADNPGDWMFHCHILEHQAAGMTSVVRVS